MWQDYVNACYELGGSIATAFSINTLLRDRMVRGVHWLPPVYFLTWGLWNLYYYAHINQPVSQLGGSLVAVTNLIWLILAWRFGIFKKHES